MITALIVRLRGRFWRRRAASNTGRSERLFVATRAATKRRCLHNRPADRPQCRLITRLGRPPCDSRSSMVGHRRPNRAPFRPSILGEIASDPLRQHMLANSPEVTGLVKMSLAVALFGFALLVFGSVIDSPWFEKGFNLTAGPDRSTIERRGP
jgi:hypothetical protein